jgi:hypothetical protein
LHASGDHVRQSQLSKVKRDITVKCHTTVHAGGMERLPQEAGPERTYPAPFLFVDAKWDLHRPPLEATIWP